MFCTVPQNKKNKNPIIGLFWLLLGTVSSRFSSSFAHALTQLLALRYSANGFLIRIFEGSKVSVPFLWLYVE